jgi:hydroxyacylglutathione hydrolase
MLRIITVEVTPFAQNARILICPATGKSAVVDPGGDVERIVDVLKEQGLSCEQIWLTHSHLDHCGGVADLIAFSGAKLVGHPNEKSMRENVVNICRMYGVPPSTMKNCPEPDVYITGGEDLTLGNEMLNVLFTPGHSPGHVSFYHAPTSTLIAGDTLFAGSIGRTDLPGADHATLISSIKNVLFALPGDTNVLPGHGPDTQIDIERKSNPFLVGAYR